MGQIARLTGLSKATVSRAVKKSRKESDGKQELFLRETEFTSYYDIEIIW